MTMIKDKTVLVTGGARGIGRHVGEYLLQAGAKKLIIWDIDKRGCHETSRDLRNAGHRVQFYVADTSKTADVERTAASILKHAGEIDILVNSAGIVVGKNFVEHSHADIDRSIHTNLLGAMHVTRAFLPHMIERGSGHIVTMASAAGLLPNRRMTAYVASKWGLVGWSESLRLELQKLGRDLHVTTVTPSYVSTGMFEGVNAPLLTPILSPEKIARTIVEAIRSNKILVRAPFMVHLIPLLRGILPARLFDFVAGKIFGVYDSMTTFTGRQRPPQHQHRRRPRRFHRPRRTSQQSTPPPSQ